MPLRTPVGAVKHALAWHRVVMQAQDTPVPDTMPIRIGGRMPTKKSKSDKKVAEAFHEVHANVPSTVKATGKTGAAKEKMLTAVALSKARAAGADIPEKPKGKKSSRASY